LRLGPLKRQVEEWQSLPQSTATAKLIIYQAFIEDQAEIPQHRRGGYMSCISSRSTRSFSREALEPCECIHERVQGTGADAKTAEDRRHTPERRELRQQVAQLKRLVADKTLEADFFKRCLAKN